MASSVSVHQGLWVHVPCQFTYPHQASSEKLHGYWYKIESQSYPPLDRSGRLVDTNDKKRAVDRSAVNRFQFMGDPDRGDCSFSINNTQWEDEGKYFFRIEQGSLKYSYVNHSNRIHTSPFIFVLALCSPEAQGDLDLVVAREGESISLQCMAESRPLPTLNWRKGNKTLSGSTKGKGHHLLLSEVRPEDAGEYQCRAETPYGSAQKTLLLRVQYGPRLSIPQGTSMCRREDHDLSCACSLHSWPPPQIQWQVDGEAINQSITGQALGVTFQAQGNELTSILNWTGIPNGDHSIICFATNPSGVHTLQFVFSSSVTRAHPSILISAFCGPLITAGLFLLGMCLIWLLKRRQVPSHSKGTRVADDASKVYNNVTPRKDFACSPVLQDPVGRYSGVYCNVQPQESVAYSCVLRE
ncbi:UNVERIFIED_CONTAM: hypothetical protein K2H54_024536 [Gekko kuhli]